VTYLLSPAADYITGATVTIDGGLSLVVAPGA
jgi:glucose 1-dehydrogenase